MLYEVFAYGLKTVRVKRCFLLPRFFATACLGWGRVGWDDNVRCFCEEVSAFQPVDTVRQKQRSDAVDAVVAVAL